jgi:hypothetical protein
MTSLSRLAACGLLAAGLTAVAVSLRPDWAGDLGIDVWNMPELQEQIARNLREQEALDREGEVVHRRMAAKRVVVADLAAERLTLLEAAARFRDLNALSPDSLHYVRTCYPGTTDEERLCRQVIAWTETELHERRADDAERVVARLRAELGELLGRDGGIRLPDPQ